MKQLSSPLAASVYKRFIFDIWKLFHFRKKVKKRFDVCVQLNKTKFEVLGMDLTNIHSQTVLERNRELKYGDRDRH